MWCWEKKNHKCDTNIKKFHSFCEQINSNFTWLSSLDVLNPRRVWTNNNPPLYEVLIRPTPSLCGFIKGTIVKVFMMMV